MNRRARDAAAAAGGAARRRSALVQGRDHLRGCACARSTTATATASATSGAWPRSSTTCRTWGSRRCGCCRSIPRRCATTATTSPTTPTSTPTCGTLADFELFLEEAHRRGIRVITELVLNHTSDQHPWFQRARRAPPGSAERDFYVWSDTPERYREARIIFQDFEPSNWSWDPVAPRLLLASLLRPPARSQLREPGGARGAAARWSTSGSAWASTGCASTPCPTSTRREGTNCENLPETHAFLKKLRAHVDARFTRPHAARRGEPVARGRRRLLRRRRRVPHELPLPDHAAASSCRFTWRTGSRSSTSWRRRRRSTTAASGRCSCATTTS